jgi:diguanylate cyclase (GGDEF)-like protein/PAS domain S-box-containing protein
MSTDYPILSAAFWRRSGNARGVTGGDIYEIDALAEIGAYPGPAILFGGGGKVLAANPEAARILKADDARAAQDLRVLLAGVAATGRPAVGQMFLPPDPVTGEAQALYYLTALSLAPANIPADQHTPYNRRVMILARDGSAEYAMRNALIESRELYRDLSRCSSDFSWQTDENGAFTFVSPKGALGYSAQALNGRRSQDLLGPIVDGADGNPFVARTPIENFEITAQGANGDRRYCRVDALPVYDKSNQWRGARGVSTDITEAKLHQQALEFMRQRESQVRAIVDATHHSLDPLTAFGNAAALFTQATGANYCAILGIDNKRRMRMLGVSSPDSAQPNSVELTRIELALHEPPPGNDIATIEFTEKGFRNAVTVTAHGSTANGVIWLKFPEVGGSDQDTRMLPDALPDTLAQSVASHIGMAIAHDNQMRRLAELSRTDELTGLLNRRAFMEDLHQRHAHLYRVSRTGALLYIDLDNFKPVNDRFGHAAGDQVLKEFANLLHGHSRIGDLCARLGGDEFAIWLEETDAAGAQTKARNLIDDAKFLHRLAGIYAPADMAPLGLSIGIAIADPQYFEQLPELIKRADEVMYQVKRQGKGSLIVASHSAAHKRQNRNDG